MSSGRRTVVLIGYSTVQGPEPAPAGEFFQGELHAAALRWAWDAKLGEGAFKGAVVHFNAGGEWLDTFFNLGIKGNAALYLAERINDVGIECSHVPRLHPPGCQRHTFVERVQ